MQRFLPLPGECVVGEGEVVADVPLSAIGALALELTLLQMGLSETLRLRSSSGPVLVVTALDNTRISKANVTRDPNGVLGFALGRNQLEYLQAVLLRAYRDQMAEVNHVHIAGDLGGVSFDLTLIFEIFRDPMSPEEAAKRMAD